MRDERAAARLCLIVDAHHAIVAAAVIPNTGPMWFAMEPREADQRLIEMDVPDDLTGPEALVTLHANYVVDEEGTVPRLVRRARGGEEG